MGCPFFRVELVTVQTGLDDTEVFPGGVVALREDLSRSKDRFAAGERCRVTTGRIDAVAKAVVADVRTRNAQAKRKRNATVHNKLPTEIATRVQVDHVLVAMHL